MDSTSLQVRGKTTYTVSRVVLTDQQKLALRAYIEMLRLKNYSEHTVKNYRNWLGIFFQYFPMHKPSSITKNEILDFLARFRKSEKWSATSQNQLINAIKFFYEKLLNRPKEYYELPRAKKPEQLPTVFSESEVLAIIKASENLKHKTILCLAYAGGLRISEIVNLKIRDVDSKRMVIILRHDIFTRILLSNSFSAKACEVSVSIETDTSHNRKIRRNYFFEGQQKFAKFTQVINSLRFAK